jgi:prepilin-type N-terminal cleavage/methylation domain-containing protein
MYRIRDQRGITLIEMTIVTVIVGIVAAIAVPQWLEVMPQLRAKAELRAMVSALREARSRAVSTKVPHGVSFDYTQNQFTVFEDSDSPELTQFTRADSALATTEVSHDVILCYHTFSDGSVIFAPDGSASSSGHVCISTDDYQYFYSLDVLASTGRVRATEGYPQYETY